MLRISMHRIYIPIQLFFNFAIDILFSSCYNADSQTNTAPNGEPLSSDSVKRDRVSRYGAGYQNSERVNVW